MTSFGPNRHSALVFAEYAEEIRRETGIDVYQMEERRKADAPVLLRLLKRYRREITDEIFAELWQEYLRLRNIPTYEEQQAKDENSLVNARAAKDELRQAGLSDAARFGYCSKIRSCKNSKVLRLLVRGFCPDCRGVAVQQDVTGDGSSISVTVDPKSINPKTLEPTTEERRTMVLEARSRNPTASAREIAKLTNVPRSTVQDILKQSTEKQNL